MPVAYEGSYKSSAISRAWPRPPRGAILIAPTLLVVADQRFLYWIFGRVHCRDKVRPEWSEKRPFRRLATSNQQLIVDIAARVDISKVSGVSIQHLFFLTTEI
jgi:hypothetical protein